MASDEDRAAQLAAALEGLTEASIATLRGIVGLSIDATNGPLLRAQVSAAASALNAQLRADAMRLRAIREDRALAALLALIADKEKVIPPWRDVAAPPVVRAESVAADTVPFLA